MQDRALLDDFPISQERVKTALRVQDRALLDDFGTLVDDQQAKSMATSLRKLVQAKNYKQVLVATARDSVVPFLCPDFVVLAQSGRVVVHPAILLTKNGAGAGEQVGTANPKAVGTLVPKVSVTVEIPGLVTLRRFAIGVDGGGEAGGGKKDVSEWTGEVDDVSDLLAEKDPELFSRPIIGGALDAPGGGIAKDHAFCPFDKIPAMFLSSCELHSRHGKILFSHGGSVRTRN